MSNLLNNFSLFHAEVPNFQMWHALRFFLAEQARFLGIQQSIPSSLRELNGAAFSLEHPMLSPIQGHYVSPSAWLPVEYQSELLLQAASGIMSVHGRASGKAQPLGVNYLSALTSAMALQAALAAAVGQLRGGAFRQVQVSPLGCGLLSIGQYLAGATGAEDRETYLPGCTDPLLRPPFQSSDGIVFEFETLESAPWRRFWEMLGIAPEVAGTAWKAFLLRYAKAISPLPKACMERLQQLPYEQIRELAEQTGVAIVPIRKTAVRQQDADYQHTVGSPWRFVSSLSVSEKPWRGVAPKHLPLRGLKVIESCRRIQGPLAGHLLALLGAEVIRLEPPGGDPLRAMPPCADGCSVRFDALNHLKTIVEVDIKSVQGRKTIYELTSQADVFLHNWAPGKAKELQLDAEHLHAVEPQLVYAYAGGWGMAPVAAPGTDFTVQAWSGVADMVAAASGTRGGSLFTVLDVLGGVIAALGVTAALFHRASVGTGGYVESSLLGSADLLVRGSLAKLEKSVMSGVFPTQSGQIAIDCLYPEQFQSLVTLLDIKPTVDSCMDSLSERLLARQASEWEAMMNKRGISACVVVEDLNQLSADARISECMQQTGYSSVNSPWSFL